MLSEKPPIWAMESFWNITPGRLVAFCRIPCTKAPWVQPRHSHFATRWLLKDLRSKEAAKREIDHVSYMVVLLRHSDEVIRSRTGPTREHDFKLTPRGEFQHPGVEEAHLVVWALAPAGVPLSAAGSPDPIAYTRAGSKVSLYRQASLGVDFASSQAGTTAALLDQPMGRTRTASAVGNQGSWLKPSASFSCHAKPNSCRIATFPKNFPRSINGWCRRHNSRTLRATSN
jgi:hypothetical protein